MENFQDFHTHIAMKVHSIKGPHKSPEINQSQLHWAWISKTGLTFFQQGFLFFGQQYMTELYAYSLHISQLKSAIVRAPK